MKTFNNIVRSELGARLAGKIRYVREEIIQEFVNQNLSREKYYLKYLYRVILVKYYFKFGL